MVVYTQWTSTWDVKAAVIVADGLDIEIIIERTFEIRVIVFSATLLFLLLLLLFVFFFNSSHAIK